MSNDVRRNIQNGICLIIDKREAGSPSAFGKRIGRLRQRVNSWKQGESAPDLNTLVVIADTYDISLDWLVRGDALKAPVDCVESAGKNGRPGLQRLRRQAGWKSAKEFAEHIGVPYNTYMPWEQGRHEMSLSTARMLADELGCSIDEIACRE